VGITIFGVSTFVTVAIPPYFQLEPHSRLQKLNPGGVAGFQDNDSPNGEAVADMRSSDGFVEFVFDGHSYRRHIASRSVIPGRSRAQMERRPLMRNSSRLPNRILLQGESRNLSAYGSSVCTSYRFRKGKGRCVQGRRDS
jgi:hypothetical protein